MVLNSSTLIALCASYINTETRLEHMFVMLRSWINQEQQCSLCISVSIVDKHLREKFDMGIETFNQTYAKKLEQISLMIYISEEQQMQFQHYKYILEKLPTLVEVNPWVIFTDDDDIWHPTRTTVYEPCIKWLIEQQRTDIDHIKCPYIVESIGMDKKDYSHASEIDDDIQAELVGNLTSTESYIGSCVKMERLHYFVMNSTDEILDSVHAGARFKYFMDSDGYDKEKQSIILPKEVCLPGWLYFYRHTRDMNGSISSNNDRLPDSIIYSYELNNKFNEILPKTREEFRKLLCNIEFQICKGVTEDQIKRETERLDLTIGVKAKLIHDITRPMYPMLDHFLEHSYYVNLKKHIHE
jgi:hypothetical protein